MAAITGKPTFAGASTFSLRVTDSTSVSVSQTFSLAIAGASTSGLSLAHVADGNNFKTTILLVNPGATDTTYTLRINDDLGNLPASGFELESGSLTGLLPAGGSTEITTSGLGTQTLTGWAGAHHSRRCVRKCHL